MLLGDLDIGGAGFLKTIQSLDKSFGGFMGTLGKVGAIAGGSFAAFQGLQAVLAGFTETLNLGGELQDLSNRTGESAGDLVILRHAFDLVGIGAGNAGDFLDKLNDSIAGVNEGGKSTAGALHQLGVSAAELRNLPALGQLEALQKGFTGIADQSSRVAIARDLFGKGGGKALALFGDAEVLEQARRQAGPLAGIMQENVAVFDKLGDVIAGLKLNFQEFFAGALSQIAPSATNIADALASVDFVGIGKTAGALAQVFLLLGEAIALLAGPLNAVGSMLSAFWGPSATGPLADKYQGFAKMNAGGGGGGAGGGVIASNLQRIGGGGGAFGGGDPILSEQRSQTRLLQRIADTLSKPLPLPSLTPVPV